MSDFPGLVGHPITIHSVGTDAVERSAFAILNNFVGAASTVYPTANTALYVPFYIPVPITVVKMGCYNGATANGNVDLGIYDAAGNQLVAAGSTAQGTINVIQEFDITDTLLPAGSYYMAFASDSASATFFAVTMLNSKVEQLLGIKTQATAFPLPAPATFVPCAFNYLPYFFLTTRTVV